MIQFLLSVIKILVCVLSQFEGFPIICNRLLLETFCSNFVCFLLPSSFCLRFISLTISRTMLIKFDS